jgi:hypothetical protein
VAAGGVSTTVVRKSRAMVKAVTDQGPLIGLAKRSKETLASEARRDMGGDMGLSNWRPGKPIQVKIRDDIKELGHVSHLKITPRPFGPMAVITHGRKGGVSSRRKSRGRSYGSSAGKGTWTRGKQRVTRDGTRILRQESTKSVVRAFRS